MLVRVAINGFGRIGRLVFRLLNEISNVKVVLINELHADAAMCAYLVNFDSVHGRWTKTAVANGKEQIRVDDQDEIRITCEETIEATPYDVEKVDLVLECTGVFKQVAQLKAFLKHGVKKVLVACPVKEKGAINVVVGCNDDKIEDYDIVTAASCTTNCIAPIIKVLLEHFTIVRGSITTIHDLTNTQNVIDAPIVGGKKNDPRRARSALMNLAPTSTGSATAIAEIFPQLKGKLNGKAIRVPLCNASITDLVIEVEGSTTAKAVNQYLQTAAASNLKGILGYETAPLVSSDYVNDPRSSIVDSLCTMVIDGSMVKIFAWYDNEVGYANRMAELCQLLCEKISP